ncbi:protein of unknown function DUF303 acetylesterase [Emticicia oligotrophica DSM 17448]|uniref:Sialate O-acetylesterase domain-containing protein n=1 Tax=Emticicia oligotrophica (strain DSM 17448 / CIP 109782 / MTCC 6937 / GPTSA100-15) TaxID=929562 RepID=A0ABM5N6Y4_EMTOG|nr:sialate O-acetylesterase [Emticicia oligotrophica]AFK05263.1 protein of unknown function DUF303 acetylesterase [Emticicia oligotrophica DSM 17448]
MKFSFKIIILNLLCTSVFAQIKLPKLISDNMVLQRDKEVNIWGWASKGEKISLDFNQLHLKTVTDAHGKWLIKLPAQKAGIKGEIILKASNELSVKNIVFGDIWVCSGQSNMETDFNRLIDKYADEIKKVDFPDIRQFLVPDKYDFHEEKEDFSGGNWQVANSKNIYTFSAVGYFFAKEIYEKHKIPIGIINSAVGGSPAEAWISSEEIKNFPNYESEFSKFKNDELIKNIEENDRNNSKSWYHELNSRDEGLKFNWKSNDINFENWDKINIPDSWVNTKYGPINGAFWFKKEINIPANLINQKAILYIGRIVDADSVFINGKFIGTTSYQYPPRRYVLQPNTLFAGKNIITVRVINGSGVGGFIKDKPYKIVFEKDTISIGGSWSFNLGTKMPALVEQTFVRWKPVGLFNAMIAPMKNLAIKGVVWYQGESNTKKASEYASLIQSLIKSWRKQWNQDNLPFLISQLPNYMEGQSVPSESDWAALRQQQLNLLNVPNTGLSVNIDLGEWNDIHPFEKKPVGQRLALQAFKLAYNQKNQTTSPIAISAKLSEKKVLITFKNAEEGLKTLRNSTLGGFALADNNGQFSWANAKIINKSQVLVWHDSITKPNKIRYAWADNPVNANLYNSINLPASPFELKVK